MTPCTGCLSLARCQLLGFPLTPQYQTLLTLILFLTLKHTQLLYVGLYSHLHFYRLYLFIGLSCTFLGNWTITLSVFVNNPLPTKRVRHVLCVIPLPSIFSLSLENILAIQHYSSFTLIRNLWFSFDLCLWCRLQVAGFLFQTYKSSLMSTIPPTRISVWGVLISLSSHLCAGDSSNFLGWIRIWIWLPLNFKYFP